MSRTVLIRADELRAGDRWVLRDLLGRPALSFRVLRVLRLEDRVTLAYDPPLFGESRWSVDHDAPILVLRQAAFPFAERLAS